IAKLPSAQSDSSPPPPHPCVEGVHAAQAGELLGEHLVGAAGRQVHVGAEHVISPHAHCWQSMVVAFFDEMLTLAQAGSLLSESPRLHLSWQLSEPQVTSWHAERLRHWMTQLGFDGS